MGLLLKGFFFSSFLGVPADADTLSGQIEGVEALVLFCYDGDTCRLLFREVQRTRVNQRIESVRIWGIDAPEMGRPFSVEARDYLRSLVVGRSVTAFCLADPSFHRRVCQLFVMVGDPAQERDVGEEVVLQGLARDYRFHSQGYYAEAQRYARRHRLGIWSLLP